MPKVHFAPSPAGDSLAPLLKLLRHCLCAAGFFFLVCESAYAICVQCPGAGYVCGTLPARPPACPTPEQYKAWKDCLKNNNVAFLNELSAAQQKMVLDCDKKYATPDTCMTQHSGSEWTREAFEQCEKDQGLERSSNRAACTHAQDPAAPAYIYELEPRQNIPAIQECDSIPHGSQ